MMIDLVCGRCGVTFGYDGLILIENWCWTCEQGEVTPPAGEGDVLSQAMASLREGVGRLSPSDQRLGNSFLGYYERHGILTERQMPYLPMLLSALRRRGVAVPSMG